MANSLYASEITVVRPIETVSPTGSSPGPADYTNHMISTDDGTDDPCRECSNG